MTRPIRARCDEPRAADGQPCGRFLDEAGECDRAAEHAPEPTTVPCPCNQLGAGSGMAVQPRSDCRWCSGSGVMVR